MSRCRLKRAFSATAWLLDGNSDSSSPRWVDKAANYYADNVKHAIYDQRQAASSSGHPCRPRKPILSQVLGSPTNVSIYDPAENVVRRLPETDRLGGCAAQATYPSPGSTRTARLLDAERAYRAAGRAGRPGLDEAKAGLWHKISWPIIDPSGALLAATAAFAIRPRSGAGAASCLTIGMALRLRLLRRRQFQHRDRQCGGLSAPFFWQRGAVPAVPAGRRERTIRSEE